MSHLIDLTGKRFGRLTVIRRAPQMDMAQIVEQRRQIDFLMGA